MKTISLRELLMPWAKLPSVILMFAGVWLAGAVGLAALQIRFPAYPDTIIPTSISVPFEPTKLDGPVCDSGSNETSKSTDCEKMNLSVSISLYKDVVGLSGKKIGTIEDFLVGQDGKINKVKISLVGEDYFTSNKDGTVGVVLLKNEIEAIKASNMKYVQKDGKNIYYLTLSQVGIEKINSIQK